MQQIADWLQKLGLSEYAQRFVENGIGVAALPHLTDQDLKEVGVLLGHRRIMLAAISELAGAAVPVTSQPTASRAEPQDTAERRQLTVMFCDLVGSTALSARLDPEDLRGIIGAYHRCATELVERNGGFVAKYMGDGVLAYFGYPQAHEHDAEHAVRAALALVEAVPKLATKAGAPLQVRVGISTGLVVVGDLIGAGAAQEQAVVGETPNLAARLQAAAAPDTVVVGLTTRRLLAGLFEYQDLGGIEVKGFAAPVQAYQVVRPSTVESRFEALRATTTPLVGRDEEIELLLRRWAQAKHGEGQVVLISGEPGIGKSRIAQTLVVRLSGEQHTRLRYFCSPYYQDSALYPSITQLERAAGFRREDTDQQRLAKLETVLAQATNDLGEVVPLLADLLSIATGDRYPPLNLTPQKRKEKTLHAQVAQVEGLAARQPVLMVFEDVHWSDPTTRESLDLLIDRVSTLRVLVIITFRPEFTPPWVGHPHVTMLNLSRLPPRLRAQMITHVTSGKALPKEIADQIIDRTDGVPLFIEELTKSVVESGVLTEAGDHYTATLPVPLLAIPTSLHASLLARLDRLAPVREVAQIAAVLGRQFSYELISAVAPMPRPQLDDGLAQLVRAELIFQRGTVPDAEYTFKHALVQDAAYDSLLKSKRAQWHSKVAQVLEGEFSDAVAHEPELLAHHFTEAGLNDRAVPYWTRAGQRALERVAFAEAVNHLATALTVNDRLPSSVERDRKELQIRLPLASAYFGSLGWAAIEVPRTLEPARDLARRLGEGEQLAPILYYVWIHHALRCEYEMADAATRELYSSAESTGDSKSLILAQMMDSCTCCWKGDFVGSCRVNAELVATYETRANDDLDLVQITNNDPKCFAQSWAAISSWVLGYPDEALNIAQDQLARARQLGHVFNLAWSLIGAGITLALRGDVKRTLEWHAEARALGQQHALASFEQYVDPVWEGLALVWVGEYKEGHAKISFGTPNWEAEGGVHNLPHMRTALAQACLGMGQIEQAQLWVRAAIQLAHQTGHRWYEAEAHRVLGDIQLALSDPAAAEIAFQSAIEVAKGQKAKSWELRAATSLARLWRDQDKRREAHDLLAPVYGWFTEGFDTPVLQEAKVLLDELSDSPAVVLAASP
jgi:class 3 adenylate cyclase/tetratricopeptide (TPR) repeat protein